MSTFSASFSSTVPTFPSPAPLVTVHHPEPALWIIELHNGQDNRLTEALVSALMSALDAIEKAWRAKWEGAQKTKDKKDALGAVVLSGRHDQDKFFSNGLDFENSMKNVGFFPYHFNPMMIRILTFPLPIVAAINGHAFAGGMMLALTCDYRVMTDGTKRNAWMCMNEIHFGAVWPMSFTALFRAKFPAQHLFRTVGLEGARLTPAEAQTLGLVDHVVPGGTKEVLAKACELARARANEARTGSWGLQKRHLYHDTLALMRMDQRPINVFQEDAAAKARL